MKKLFNQKRNENYSTATAAQNYSAYCLLFAVANYSKNEYCQGRAAYYLTEGDDDYKKHCAAGEGSFMAAVLQGDILTALRRGDGANRAAIAEAIKNNEIDYPIL